jgi:hypothetical protein
VVSERAAAPQSASAIHFFREGSRLMPKIKPRGGNGPVQERLR